MSFRKARLAGFAVVSLSVLVWSQTAKIQTAQTKIGQEVAIPVHLQDGDEYRVSTRELIEYGRTLFTAMWTSQEGAGRPLTKGTGAPLSDPGTPLLFPRNFNRISGPDTNSCSGCHNKPYVGGGGDIANNVFVLGQRFDFLTFNPAIRSSPAAGSTSAACRSRCRPSPIRARPSACSARATSKCSRGRSPLTCRASATAFLPAKAGR